MRVGQNPAKFVQGVTRPQRVTVAVLTCIPALKGFHAQALDVLKACLDSLWTHTSPDHDLMVFDNGSGPETVAYLLEAHQAGRIQYLTLSEKNLGKGGAWNQIFTSAPGEILAYTDSDAEFSPGWLEELAEDLGDVPQGRHGYQPPVSDATRVLRRHPRLGGGPSGRPDRTRKLHPVGGLPGLRFESGPG